MGSTSQCAHAKLKNHKNKNSRHKVSSQRLINKSANLAYFQNGECNDIHALAFEVGGQGPNPNNLNYKQGMEASDCDMFE